MSQTAEIDRLRSVLRRIVERCDWEWAAKVAQEALEYDATSDSAAGASRGAVVGGDWIGGASGVGQPTTASGVAEASYYSVQLTGFLVDAASASQAADKFKAALAKYGIEAVVVREEATGREVIVRYSEAIGRTEAPVGVAEKQGRLQP